MAQPDAMLEQGTLKVYYALKGFGFIQRSSGKDIFFHRSAVADEATIIPGSVVRFRLTKTDKGLQATDLQRVG